MQHTRGSACCRVSFTRIPVKRGALACVVSQYSAVGFYSSTTFLGGGRERVPGLVPGTCGLLGGKASPGVEGADCRCWCLIPLVCMRGGHLLSAAFLRTIPRQLHRSEAAWRRVDVGGKRRGTGRRTGPDATQNATNGACSRAQISESPSVIGCPAASVLSAALGREVGIVSDTCSLAGALWVFHARVGLNGDLGHFVLGPSSAVVVALTIETARHGERMRRVDQLLKRVCVCV